MADDSEPLFAQDAVDALRRLLFFARAQDGMGLSRRQLVNAASVRGSDIDNFLPGKGGKPKAVHPHDRILIRLTRLVAVDPRFATAVKGNPARQADFDHVRAVFLRLPTVAPDDDFLFLHLKQIQVLDQEQCETFHSNFHKAYYGYRFSTRSNRILKSHFKIETYDPTRKVPTFVHRMKFEDGHARFTRGQIIEIGNCYVFIGFVFAGTYDYRGVKLLVAEKNPFGKTDRLNGTFISYAGVKGHEAGLIQLVATADLYDEEKIGEFPLDELSKTDPGFKVEEIRPDIATRLDNTFLVGALTLP
jgi:hypothetical protein